MILDLMRIFFWKKIDADLAKSERNQANAGAAPKVDGMAIAEVPIGNLWAR